MKYKKVMALFFSAALSVNILSGCSILPGTVYGMEAAIGNTGEGETDGAKRGSPADTQESNEGSAGRTLSAAEEEGTVLEQTAASEEAGSEAQPSDEGVPPSGQEEVAPPMQETGSGGDDLPEETIPAQETQTTPATEQAGTEAPATEPVTETATEDPKGSESGRAQTEQTSELQGVTEGQTEQKDPNPAGEEASAQPLSEEEIMQQLDLEMEEDETETEEDTEYYGEDFDNNGVYYSGGSYWDKSWYFKRDFRFTQVDKVYGIASASRLARIYEAPDASSGIVGEIPYYGLAYILDEKDGFYYIESGDVRGFIPKEDLTAGDITDETVDLLGEESFDEAQADVEIPDNTAFTYTKTTTRDVLSEKDYAITYMEGAILEYPKDGAREIGTIGNGTLIYVLEDAGNGWLFVESGDVRGFIRSEVVLTGEGAKVVTEDMGEGTISLAEEVIPPEENRSLYYTLSSVKPAVDEMGESVCEYALSFEGKLPYVYGGTSLGFGADCSGFTQSVFSCFGISIPRTAQDQGNSGQAVDGLENAKPGDIIYYGSGPHVGIYLGDGKVIQCSGNESNTPDNPGSGPTVSAVDYMPITSIRRYIIETDGTIPGLGEGGNRQDGSIYSQEQLELIWAIVAQEDNGSYEGALAVISSAMNRTESGRWGGCGGDALTQLTAPGQYCYSLDDYWRPRLGGNVPEYVKQAVNDCLVKGIRNHPYTSFRSRKGKTTGNDAVQIGGNWYFGA